MSDCELAYIPVGPTCI